jgi:uncharacterized protein (TIGR03089 family)
VAKTAGYLTDDRGIDDGDVVAVRLPLHWQTAVIVLASWAAGAQVAFDGDGVVSFVAADDPAPPDDGDSTIALSLAPMGMDFSRLVAAQPDSFVPLAASGDDLVEAAASDLPREARVLSVLPFAAPAALSYGLIAPLDAGGSLVLVRHPAPDAVAGHASTERVTHTLGIEVAGLSRLDR